MNNPADLKAKFRAIYNRFATFFKAVSKDTIYEPHWPAVGDIALNASDTYVESIRSPQSDDQLRARIATLKVLHTDAIRAIAPTIAKKVYRDGTKINLDALPIKDLATLTWAVLESGFVPPAPACTYGVNLLTCERCIAENSVCEIGDDPNAPCENCKKYIDLYNSSREMLEEANLLLTVGPGMEQQD